MSIIEKQIVELKEFINYEKRTFDKKGLFEKYGAPHRGHTMLLTAGLIGKSSYGTCLIHPITKQVLDHPKAHILFTKLKSLTNNPIHDEWFAKKGLLSKKGRLLSKHARYHPAFPKFYKDILGIEGPYADLERPQENEVQQPGKRRRKSKTTHPTTPLTTAPKGPEKAQESKGIAGKLEEVLKIKEQYKLTSDELVELIKALENK